MSEPRTAAGRALLPFVLRERTRAYDDGVPDIARIDPVAAVRAIEDEAVQPWREWVSNYASAYHYALGQEYHAGQWEFCANITCKKARALLETAR